MGYLFALAKLSFILFTQFLILFGVTGLNGRLGFYSGSEIILNIALSSAIYIIYGIFHILYLSNLVRTTRQAPEEERDTFYKWAVDLVTAAGIEERRTTAPDRTQTQYAAVFGTLVFLIGTLFLFVAPLLVGVVVALFAVQIVRTEIYPIRPVSWHIAIAGMNIGAVLAFSLVVWSAVAIAVGLPELPADGLLYTVLRIVDASTLVVLVTTFLSYVIIFIAYAFTTTYCFVFFYDSRKSSHGSSETW